MAIHNEVLEAARQITSKSDDSTFTIAAVINALPHLNGRTVRTHIASRCCVNAPKNHASKLPYFRRVAYGVYQVEPDFR